MENLAKALFRSTVFSRKVTGFSVSGPILGGRRSFAGALPDRHSRDPNQSLSLHSSPAGLAPANRRCMVEARRSVRSRRFTATSAALECRHWSTPAPAFPLQRSRSAVSLGKDKVCRACAMRKHLHLKSFPPSRHSQGSGAGRGNYHPSNPRQRPSPTFPHEGPATVAPGSVERQVPARLRRRVVAAAVPALAPPLLDLDRPSHAAGVARRVLRL